MSARALFRNGIAWMVMSCFFSLASLQALPAAAGPDFFEKEATPAAQKATGRRFPLFVVLGAAVVAGVLVYFLVGKKSSEEDPQ